MSERIRDPFFNLKEPYKIIESDKDFWEDCKGNSRIFDVLYKPDEFYAGEAENGVFKFTNIYFNNVSFSLTELKGFTFRDCKFENCQFFRTKFLELEFHDCEFIMCNMSKCIFQDTYITPESFKNCLDTQAHTNVGTHLFQQLMKNAKNLDQPDFYKLADFQFMKWKRYEKEYEYREGKINKFYGAWNIFINFLYQWLLGYGIRLRHFIVSALVIFSFFWILNTCNLVAFGLGGLCVPDGGTPWECSFYYTAVSLSNLGYGDITPATIEGRIWASIQAVVGAIMFAIMASVIFKKFSR